MERDFEQNVQIQG